VEEVTLRITWYTIEHRVKLWHFMNLDTSLETYAMNIPTAAKGMIIMTALTVEQIARIGVMCLQDASQA
jgi:hypothetical protein